MKSKRQCLDDYKYWVYVYCQTIICLSNIHLLKAWKAFHSEKAMIIHNSKHVYSDLSQIIPPHGGILFMDFHG